ncbi:RNA polymerase sigma factor [Skermania sp. ID1734]|uniref:RNA polymerase sigma factor n=1 Tax=Skermania sp. ID1734 TaxID=2597516 RepID=UPI00117E42F9|nr:RNA polymerase sigma factor [Skermania sp. ID1734]TSE02112.1 RNA polymerase sigma factor [Skermania sp. ID1734]
MAADAGVAAALDEVFRAEFGRVVATLIRRFGNIDLAEDMAAEAFVEASRRWPVEGMPPNPGAWLTTTARNRGIDRLRRESSRDAREAEAHSMTVSDDSEPLSTIPDDRLRLFFTCCHPALATEVHTALTLRLLGGLSVAEIAAAFLVPERTMAQRITRAKRKIAAAKIPYAVPRDAELPRRLRGVLAAIYLVFNEGYLPSSGSDVRTDLCAEAIRLARVLRSLMPDEPEVIGLLALMLLTDARRPARFADGVLVPLAEQDRTAWNRGLIAEGHELARWCLRRGQPGQYQILAAINAVHTDTMHAEHTDWRQIVALYDQLWAIAPTPVVALNRAIAVAETEGATAGLAIAETLSLDGYHPYHAALADLQRRAGRLAEARTSYDRAIELAASPGQRRYLRRRRDELS